MLYLAKKTIKRQEHEIKNLQIVCKMDAKSVTNFFLANLN